MESILITGNTGMVGINLVNYLKKDFTIYKFNSQSGDIMDFCESKKIDYVIHTAAETKDTSKMLESNLALTMNLLEWARIGNPKKIILIGSGLEYKPNEKGAYSESDLLHGDNMYAATKSAISVLAEGYSKEYGLAITIVKPFYLFGKGEKETKFISTLLDAYKRDSEIEFVEAGHDIVYIKDFVKGLINILLYKEKELFNIVNFGTGKNIKNSEIISELELILNYKFSIKEIEKLYKYDNQIYKSKSKLLKDKYGFEFQYDFKSALKDFVDEILHIQ